MLDGLRWLFRRRAKGPRPGCVIWFTGLPCSGKSTVAEALAVTLRAEGRPVAVLDGDVMRRGLCAGLGFSREDRAENLRRLREAAKLLANAGVVAIVAAITPYEADRKAAKEGIERCLLAWVYASPETCERRDVKGMWAKARRGEIRGFTGVDDAFEQPVCHDVMLWTDCGATAEECAGIVAFKLGRKGWL